MTSEPKLGKPAWLLFVLTLQGQQPAVRMRVWRALRALGTAVMRDGGFVLPKPDEVLQPLQAQIQEGIASGGSAQILAFEAGDKSPVIEVRQVFDREAH